MKWIEVKSIIYPSGISKSKLILNKPRLEWNPDARLIQNVRDDKSLLIRIVYFRIKRPFFFHRVSDIKRASNVGCPNDLENSWDDFHETRLLYSFEHEKMIQLGPEFEKIRIDRIDQTLHSKCCKKKKMVSTIFLK